MRAAIKRGNRIVCETIADPVPGAGQVLIRTLACGICGSDLHALDHAEAIARIYRRAGVENVLDPARDVVFGHEFAGEILEYGPATQRRLKPGTLVTSIPRLLGASGAHVIGYSNVAVGGFAERMLLTESLLLEVPNGLTPCEAALTEPFAVGEHAVAGVDLRGVSAVLVVGCGPVGLAVIAALKLRGVGPVIAADYASGRRALAESMGADALIDPAAESAQRGWADAGVPLTRADRFRLLAEGGRPGRALIFECVGVPGVIQSLIDEAPAAAQIIVVGVCMEADRFQPGTAIAKELELRFSFAYTADEFAATLRNIAEGRIDPALAVTRRVGLDQVPEAFAALASPEEQAKIIVEPTRASL
jgi:threonine dehydrogenase-like Zn-dependent dehydrogenase